MSDEEMKEKTKENFDAIDKAQSSNIDNYMSENFIVKPSFYKGGKGPFSRLTGHCMLKFRQNNPPKLVADYNPPGTIWLAILATIATGLVVAVIAQVVGFMAGPGLIIWYWIISAARRKQIEISLADSEQIVCDDQKRNIAIFGLVENQKTWISIKCPNDYGKIVYLLKQTDNVCIENRKLQTSQLTMIIVLVILLVLVAFFWILAMQSF